MKFELDLRTRTAGGRRLSPSELPVRATLHDAEGKLAGPVPVRGQSFEFLLRRACTGALSIEQLFPDGTTARAPVRFIGELAPGDVLVVRPEG
jgi:hypothetical protein